MARLNDWLDGEPTQTKARHRYRYTPIGIAIRLISLIVMALSTLQAKLILREGNRK
jgi:hypothetical protein